MTPKFFLIPTLGSTPYTGLHPSEVMKKVRDGYRLEKPEHCKRELYNIMVKCWEKSAENRPTFSDLVRDFEGLFTFCQLFVYIFTEFVYIFCLLLLSLFTFTEKCKQSADY